MLCTSSVHLSKNFPPQRYINIANLLRSSYPASVLPFATIFLPCSCSSVRICESSSDIGKDLPPKAKAKATNTDMNEKAIKTKAESIVSARLE